MTDERTLALSPREMGRLLASPLPTWRRAAVIATTSEATITYWNAAAERLYRRRAADVVGRNFLDVLPTRATRARSAEIIGYLQAGRPFAGERTPRTANGLPIRVFILAMPVGDLTHGRGSIVTVSAPIAQRRLIWRDAARLQAEIERRLARHHARYAARRPQLAPALAPAAALERSFGAGSALRSTIRLAALHRRAGIAPGAWGRMQRVEIYRHRADRLDRAARARFGEAALARMWRRLADRAAARR